MFSWREVYICNAYGEYNRIMNLLEDCRIRTKTKIQSNGSLSGGNIFFGSNSNGMPYENKQYRIFVKKADLDEATFIINSKGRR